MAIDGTGKMQRTARALLVAARENLARESGYEPFVEVAQTPHSITMELELPNNERWVVSITGKEVVLPPSGAVVYEGRNR